MIILNDEQNSEILEDPQKLLNNYNKLLECIANLVNAVNIQVGITNREEYEIFKKIKEHSEIVVRMRKEVKREMDLFSSYINLCEEKIKMGDDVEGIYKRQKKAFERLQESDKKLLTKLQKGEREYKIAIQDIQKIYDNLEE